MKKLYLLILLLGMTGIASALTLSVVTYQTWYNVTLPSINITNINYSVVNSTPSNILSVNYNTITSIPSNILGIGYWIPALTALHNATSIGYNLATPTELIPLTNLTYLLATENFSLLSVKYYDVESGIPRIFSKRWGYINVITVEKNTTINLYYVKINLTNMNYYILYNATTGYTEVYHNNTLIGTGSNGEVDTTYFKIQIIKLPFKINTTIYVYPDWNLSMPIVFYEEIQDPTGVYNVTTTIPFSSRSQLFITQYNSLIYVNHNGIIKGYVVYINSSLPLPTFPIAVYINGQYKTTITTDQNGNFTIITPVENKPVTLVYTLIPEFGDPVNITIKYTYAPAFKPTITVTPPNISLPVSPYVSPPGLDTPEALFSLLLFIALVLIISRQYNIFLSLAISSAIMMIIALLLYNNIEMMFLFVVLFGLGITLYKKMS